MIDVLPTLLDFIDYDIRSIKSLDGHSQKNTLLNNKQIISSNYAVTNIFNDTYAVISAPYKLIINEDNVELYNIFKDPTEELDISKNEPEITKKLIEIFNNWPKGSNRSLSVIESLMDPDTFGGKEDRLPYVEQAFINAEESID
jgi:hypothetical protein